MLYLREDLIKANELDANTPVNPPVANKPLGGSADNMQPCSVGGGDACIRAGGNGANQHKIGGAVERKHSEWRASQGAGAAKEETAAPESKLSSEEAQESISQHADAINVLDPQGRTGTTSTDPASYPEETTAIDHYRAAAVHRVLGGGNDSSKEISEGHRKMARDKSAKMTPEEHDELASQLRKQNLGEDADQHEKLAGERRAVQADGESSISPQDESVKVVEKVGQDVEDAASRKEKLKDESVKVVEKVGQDVEDAASRKEKLKDDDPFAHATEEYNTNERKSAEKYSSSVESFKQKVDKKHTNIVASHKKNEAAEKVKYSKAIEKHKKGLDQKYAKEVKTWEKAKKGQKAWEQLSKKHKEREPAVPKAFTGTRPKAARYDLPKQGKKFDSDVAKYEKAKLKSKKEIAKIKSQKHAWRAEGLALKKQKPSYSEKKPGKPNYKTGVPKAPTKAPAPKHPGYKTGAPKAPDSKKAPDPKAFKARKPSSSAERASHLNYLTQAKSAQSNIETHLQSGELSDDEKAKLEEVYSALGSHGESDRLATKEQSDELKNLLSIAGKHGKKPAENKQTEQSRAPKTDLEQIQLADHKSKSAKMRSNIQSHIDSIQLDDSIPQDQKAADLSRLKQINSTLESHANLENMPTAEQASELKELQKVSGAQGKKPFEEKAGTSKEENTQAKRSPGRKRDWAAAFGRGAAAGTRTAQAAQSPTGAGALGAQALGGVTGGVLSAGDSLLNGPSRGAIDKKRKQADRDTKAAQEARKRKSNNETASEDTMKGLYLNLDLGLDLIKAVISPNSGTVTESGKRAQRHIKESYAKEPVGVMGGAGIAMKDDPDVGKKWKHGEKDSVEAELEAEVRNKDSKDDDDADEETSKSEEAINILKSLRHSTEADLSFYKHDPSEVMFLIDVLGYTEKDIHKGLVSITGKNRHRFHEWMLDRMHSSVDSMLERVNFG